MEAFVMNKLNIILNLCLLMGIIKLLKHIDQGVKTL
jgi:hypothetical protein